MKIVALNSSDCFGGAARAAYRLHAALRTAGVDALMLVQRKFSDDPYVIGPATVWERGLGLVRNQIDKLPLWLFGHMHNPLFSLSIVPSNTVTKTNMLKPDIVHLHWICEGLTSIGSLKGLKAPVIWTMHDSWPFTGGCHVPHDCTAYREHCGCCPQLGSSCTYDLSRAIWSRKSRLLKSLQPVMVAPSRWLAACAAESSLMRNLRIEVIPNGIDSARFKPMDKAFSRNSLGMEAGKRILLFSAIDGIQHYHKGFHLLKKALEICARQDGFKDSTVLCIAGSSAPADFPEMPIPVRFIGQLRDDATIAMLYNAVDLYLAPALLENFSNTVLEAMSCGTPTVAFNAGGMSDLLEHGTSGYLATPYDVDDFARGIAWSFENDNRLTTLSENGRRRVEACFALDVVSKRYLNLYEDVWLRSRS